MNKLMKSSVLLLIIILLLGCLNGFAEEDKIIRLAWTADIDGMDPYDDQTYLNMMLYYMIYDRLVEYNPEAETPGQFVPSLATEWEISSDATEYTFKLREGVKFHNGEPFNAECVKVSLERLINEETLRARAQFLDLEMVEVINDYLITLKFTTPNVVCLQNLIQIPIIPAKAFKEKGKDMFLEESIGTGAFIWDHWIHGREIVLNKNQDYWGEPAYMDRFILFPIGESSTRLAGVITGEIDICGDMSTYQIPIAESSGNIDVIRKLLWDQIYLALKTDKPPFTDVKFRQAIALALDKEGITNHVMKGGRVATGVLVPGILGFDDNIVPIKQDIEKAKQLLKESTYDGRVIDIMVPIGWFPNERDVAQALKDNLDEIGVNTKLSILESASFVERRAVRDYDIFLNNDSHPGDVSVWLMRIIAADVHEMGDINIEVKKLAQEQAESADTQKRIEILRKVENMINSDFGPTIMLCQFEGIYFQRNGIEGARYYGDRCMDFRHTRYEDWEN